MTHRERESQQQENESDIEESEEEGEFWVHGSGYLGGFGWGTWGVHGGREAIENLK